MSLALLLGGGLCEDSAYPLVNVLIDFLMLATIHFGFIPVLKTVSIKIRKTKCSTTGGLYGEEATSWAGREGLWATNTMRPFLGPTVTAERIPALDTSPRGDKLLA